MVHTHINIIKELLRGPGIEHNLLANPTTRVAMLSSLGGAYLMLWRARGETTSGNNSSSGGGGQGKGNTQGVAEIRLDVSSDRTDLLHRAQGFLEEALTAPENINDAAIRAQVGERPTRFWRTAVHVHCLDFNRMIIPTVQNVAHFILRKTLQEKNTHPQTTYGDVLPTLRTGSNSCIQCTESNPFL